MKFKRMSVWILIVLCSLLLLGACSNEAKDMEEAKKIDEVYEPKPDPEASQISTYNEERIETQEEIEEEIINEYKEGTYTLSDPLVKVDPYDASPLSAVLLFETEEPVQIQVTTGEGETAISELWEEPATIHEIPVLGLHPGQENTVTVEAIDEKETSEEVELNIETEALPDDFLQTEVVESQPDKMGEGLTFITPTSGYLYAVDEAGAVRWYSSLRSRLIFNRLRNGHMIQNTRKDDADQYNELLELDMVGKIYHAYNIKIEGYDDGNLLHHEVIELPSGNLLATTHEPNGDYVEDHMHEIDRETGRTNQEINLRDVMPENAPVDYEGKSADKGDWIHQNAVFYDETDQSILVSGRSQDVILKISYPDAELEWILGADEKWPDAFEQYVLDPIGDVDFPAGQHAMKLVDNPDLADQPQMKDVILFDNNEVITRGDRDASEEYSQAIRYLVDEEEGTVEQTWAYGKERGKSFFSHIIGNVQYLYDQDNMLVTSGSTEDEDSPTGVTGRVVEVDTSDDPNVIFELAIQGKEEDAVKYTYRAWRFLLYPEEEWHFSMND